MMTNQETKRCSHCKRIKFVTDFALLTRRSDGIQYYDSYCRECRREVRKKANREAAHERNLQRIALREAVVVGEGEKRCPCCNKALPHSAFYKNKNCPDGLHTYCKECYNNKYTRGKQRRPSMARIGVFRSTVDGRLRVLNGKSGGHKIYWTGDMLSLLHKHYATTSNKDLAGMIGLCDRVVREKATELGLVKSRQFIHERYSRAAKLRHIARRKQA